jgi:hypothetical protein
VSTPRWQRLRAMLPAKTAIHRRPNAKIQATGAVLVAALIALTATWPDWTLRYIHALAWPVVALIAVAVFGPALARRVPALSALHLPLGVIATFQEQANFDAEAIGAEAIEALPAAAGPDPLETANVALRILGVVAGAFQFQLDFLRALTTAPDGLTPHAAGEWFDRAIEAHPIAESNDWASEQLLAWLVGNHTIELAPDGSYRLSRLGRQVLDALELPSLFVAPKVF